jgi:flagellar hook-length control protein FliK
VARDGSLFAQPAPAGEPRGETLAAAEAKPPSAPPEPPGGSGRAGEILRQLRVQFSPELRSATIQLSPPELGRISIRMRMERGELHTLVRAERRETLDALQRHVPELRATLEQLGIQARELDLQLGFEQRGARQDPEAPRAGIHAGAGREHEPELREAQLLRTLSARSGGIDTYA